MWLVSARARWPVPRKRLSVAPRRQVRQAAPRSSQLTDITMVQRSVARGTVTYTGRWMKTGANQIITGRPERVRDFRTISLRPVDRVYGPSDVASVDYDRDLADPGVFPYTRGIHETGYRGKLWTMRQFAGFGTPEATNARYRHLLEEGGTGLSVAFDLPTLMGRDPDHPLSLGEVGKCGVAVSSLADMEILLAGIPLGEVSTSMTINSPAAMLLAFYVAAAEKQGVAPERLAGTVQADILKEFIAQKEYIYPPRPSM